MSEPAAPLLCRSYDDLIDAFRRRVVALNVTHETIDAISGLQGGYVGKLLAPVPIRSLGRVSLGPMLQSLGLAISLVEDPAAMEAIKTRLVVKQGNTMPSAGRHEVVTIQISRKKLRRIARRGGRNRAKNLTTKQLSMIGKKAARGRWKRRRRIRAARPRATPAATRLPAPCAS